MNKFLKTFLLWIPFEHVICKTPGEQERFTVMKNKKKILINTVLQHFWVNLGFDDENIKNSKYYYTTWLDKY